MLGIRGASVRMSAAVAFLLAGSAALAGTLTPIAPYSDPLSLGTGLIGINNAGWTTGNINYAGDTGVGFLRSPTGVYTIFDNTNMPTALYTSGRAISNDNTVIGFSFPATNLAIDIRGYKRLADGTITTLTNPTSGLPLAGIAQGINDGGAIVGNFRAPSSEPGNPIRNHGYILDGSTFTELTSAGFPAASVNARGIANDGTVVGWTSDSTNGTRAFTYAGGAYEFLRHPLDSDPGGFGTTIFEAINNNGQILGGYSLYYDTENFYNKAFMYDPVAHTFTDIDVPGANNVQTWGINDLGQYVVNSDAGQFIYSPDGPTAPDGSPVFLPVAGGSLPPGQAQFAFTVVPGTTYYIDPAFATGFEYLAGSGPLFTSVTAPSGLFPSNIYELWLWNGASYAFASNITGGIAFTFEDALDRFQLRGIPRSAGIDAETHEGFITGLTFASAGQFDGFQIALSGAVPEPASWAMLIAGFGLVGAVQRRRRRQAVAV
jgi:probable HAF family extracellular repeat protein